MSRHLRFTAVRRALGARPALLIGLGLLVPLVLACLLVPSLWPHSADALVAQSYLPPSSAFPFGTDDVGRDLVPRVFAGGALDLFIAAIVVGISLLLGTVIGVASAMSGRRSDAVAMRFVDAVLAFPFLILVLALTVVIGPERVLGPLSAGVPSIIGALILVDWAIYARLTRAQTMSLRSRDYVTAGELLGYSRSRIVLRHLMPNVLGVAGAYAAADAVLVVVTTASLSFLGVGVQPPTAEWGSIMFEGRAVLATSWWITVIPGVFLAVAGLGLSIVADALIDIKDAA
jgi:peptide/nickel transport system permease protein